MVSFKKKPIVESDEPIGPKTAQEKKDAKVFKVAPGGRGGYISEYMRKKREADIAAYNKRKAEEAAKGQPNMNEVSNPQEYREMTPGSKDETLRKVY